MQGTVAMDKPLAVWFFIRPQFIDAYHAFKGGNNTFQQAKGHLPKYTYEQVKAELDEFKNEVGAEAVVEVKQYAGQIVYVAPGWLHTVLNLQPCIKMAWDYQEVQNLPLYIRSWKQHNRFKVGEDYSGLMNLLLQGVDGLVRKLGLGG